MGQSVPYTADQLAPQFQKVLYKGGGDGIFLQPDPVGINGGINLYAYVLNNPVNWIDPWGLEVWYGTRAKKPYKKQHGIIRHDFIKIDDKTYGKVSKYPVGPGEIVEDDPWDQNYQEHDGELIPVPDIDEEKLLENIKKDQADPPFYCVIPGTGNCQDWVKEQLEKAKKKKGDCK